MTKTDKILFALIISALLFLFLMVIKSNQITINNSPLPTLIISQNALIASVSPLTPKYVVSGVMVDIIQCESSGNYKAQNPKSTAYGLCQFTSPTWRYVQNKWNIKLIRDNEEDQKYACNRLLEEEGIKHWKSSRYCWSK